MFRCIPNHRSSKTFPLEDLNDFRGRAPVIEDRSKFREWCGAITTDHCFYSLVTGLTPSLRITNDNPVFSIGGFVADYDVQCPDDLDRMIRENKNLVMMPTITHKTASGHFRIIWQFAEAVTVDERYARTFLTEISKQLNAKKLFAGYDICSEATNQYYEIGYDHVYYNCRVDPAIVMSALFTASGKKTVETESDIPFEAVQDEVLKRFSHRLESFELNQRVPLFWIDDGIDRAGGQVSENGIVCYSDRAGKGFVDWREILGAKFTGTYENNKISNAITDIYYDGKRYHRFTARGLFDSPKEDLMMELRQSGLNANKKKGQQLSEVESALLFIQNQNRVHGVAPVLHSDQKVLTINGSVILNSSRCKPTVPAEAATVEDFPFLHSFFSTFLDDPDNSKPIDYLFAWMKRSYEAMHYHQLLQGQAVILVGPTGRGKSLFSNKIFAGLLGGVATAGDYLQARTQFNKELAENPAWSIDDSASATNAADHRKFTELLKARIANPFINCEMKYADSMRIPHIGRVIISLNEDVQSLSVVPALDVSNSDKILGFRISNDHRPNFLPNVEMEAVIDQELPYFARWLLDWQAPEHVTGNARYGVNTYMHEFIRNAARDNGTRAPALEAIELFVQVHRNASTQRVWKGTATELRSLFCEYPDLSGLSFGRDHYALARGLASAEEVYIASAGSGDARPVTSESRGRGKKYTIDLSPEFDDED